MASETTTHPNLLLRRARFNKGMTKRLLAAQAGVSIQTIISLENHGKPPRADTAKRIADVLGLKPTDLFDLPLPGEWDGSAA